MAKVTVVKPQPVEPTVNLSLTLSEARVLKRIVAYRSRVAQAIYNARHDREDMSNILTVGYNLFAALHDAGVHADPNNDDDN